MGFSNYSKQAPQSGKAVPYVLRGLRNPDGSHPVLHVAYLGEANRPYWLESLARAKAKQTDSPSDGTPAELDRRNREERLLHRETLSTYSARHVTNAFHDDGSAATDKDIRAIVGAIPDVDFEYLWHYVHNDGNFRDYAIASDPAALAEK